MKLRNEEPEALLRLPEAAAFLGVKESTLRFWRWQDRGPASFKVGNAVVYRREALETWLAEQAEATTRGGR